MKKNKQRNAQKKKQARALKSQRRRKDFIRSKLEEISIHWDDLYFLDNWKSLSPEALLEQGFQMDVEEWIGLYPKPKKDQDWLDLRDSEIVSEWFNFTIDDTLKAWASDTKGFTENLPERYQFTEKNQNRFISLMKEELDEWNDEVEANVKEMMNNDRSEWFSVVFNDMLDDIVERLAIYITSQVIAWSLV